MITSIGDNLPEDASQLIAQIREAFSGVVLGDGVGLQQAQGMDDYLDDETIRAMREFDEKLNWEKFTPEQLDRNHSSLCFFDPEGMRFHLPAYLIADLRKELKIDPIMHLTWLNDYARGKLALLSPDQRRAVRRYLYYVKDKPGYEFDVEAIELALMTYWARD